MHIQYIIDGFAEDCSISSALVMEILQSLSHRCIVYVNSLSTNSIQTQMAVC